MHRLTTHQQIVALFADAGLTRNEALAYLALLESPEEEGLTGYEVAARSGIPRSAVYAVMRKLETARACFSTGESPARYRATAPATLVGDMRYHAVGQLDKLASELDRFPKRSFPEPIWTYASYDDVIARTDAMIRRAERSVYLSLWAREAAALAPALAEVADRKLHRVVFSTDRLGTPPPGFSVWSDELTSDAEKATWSHKILAIVDRREAVIGGAEPDADNHAVHTRNPSLVDVATNHVILDITLLAQRTGRDCSDDVSPMMRPHLL